MIVTFKDYRPPQRFDGKPFTDVRIEESASEDGPFALVETQALSPLDTSPDEPMGRDFTTELATVQNGWFQVTFIDADGDESLPTDPVQYGAMPPYATVSEITPTLAEVAALIPGRVVENGEGVNGFTADTIPTAAQVQTLINLNAGEIESRCESIRPWLVSLATKCVALATAIEIERGYFPQEQDNDASILADLQTDFNVKVSRLEARARLAYASVMP